MKNLSLLFLSIFCVQVANAAAPNVSEYAFEQKVNTLFDAKKMVGIELTEDVISNNDVDFSRLQLVNDQNEEVPFTLFDIPATQVDKLETLKVSSARNNVSPSNLLDDNRLTKFAFDEKSDGAEASTIWLDFGEIVYLHRLELWPVDTANIPGYELKGGVREDQLKTIKRKTAFQTFTDLDFPPLRYMEIRLWGNNIRLEDVNLYVKPKALIYFEAEPSARYRVLFGNPAVNSKRYLERVSEPLEVDIMAKTSKTAFNPLSNEDIDGDGVINTEDNCVFVENKNQKDRDEDKIGDKCDNALEAKNYNQSDIDRDGKGDIIDNCKLIENPDQSDRDRDGRGDACDTRAVDGDSATISGEKNWFWFGLIGAALIGVVAFIVGSKQKKK